MSTDLGVWLGAFMTISLYSVLFKENQFFEAAQSVFVGLAAAHTLVLGYQSIVQSAWQPLVAKGQLALLVPIILGLLLYTRFTKTHGWLSRVPMAFLVGSAAGVSVKAVLTADLQKQIVSSMTLKWSNPNDFVFLLFLLSTLSYFLFLRAKGAPGAVQAGVSVIGTWAMMTAFGAALGFTVMGRLSLLIGRLQFLFGSWIPLIK